jgi:hypothetical protein
VPELLPFGSDASDYTNPPTSDVPGEFSERTVGPELPERVTDMRRAAFDDGARSKLTGWRRTAVLSAGVALGYGRVERRWAGWRLLVALPAQNFGIHRKKSA